MGGSIGNKSYEILKGVKKIFVGQRMKGKIDSVAKGHTLRGYWEIKLSYSYYMIPN